MPATRSVAPSVSAKPSATLRNTLLRAGTYVLGIASAMVASSRPFGTASAAVSDEPPIARRAPGGGGGAVGGWSPRAGRPPAGPLGPGGGGGERRAADRAKVHAHDA